jgi:hypothetical protein
VLRPTRARAGLNDLFSARRVFETLFASFKEVEYKPGYRKLDAKPLCLLLHIPQQTSLTNFFGKSAEPIAGNGTQGRPTPQTMKRGMDDARSNFETLRSGWRRCPWRRVDTTGGRETGNRRGRSIRRVAQKPYSPMREFALKNQCFERAWILAFNHVFVCHGPIPVRRAIFRPWESAPRWWMQPTPHGGRTILCAGKRLITAPG